MPAATSDAIYGSPHDRARPDVTSPSRFVVASASALLAGLWLILGPRPRRAPGLRRLARALEQGDWQDGPRRCRAAADGAGVAAGGRTGSASVAGESPPARHRRRPQGQAIRRSAATQPPGRRSLLGRRRGRRARQVIDAHAGRGAPAVRGRHRTTTDGVLQLLARVFWPCNRRARRRRSGRACVSIRQGEVEPALAALTSAHEQAGKHVHRPGLLPRRRAAPAGPAAGGPALPRRSQPHRRRLSVRHLADGRVAGRVRRRPRPGRPRLQRALGPRGLPLWRQRRNGPGSRRFPRAAPTSAGWPRAPLHLPGPRRRPQRRHPGGAIGLAQAHYRQGSFQEAADLYNKLLQDSPPTLVLLRGLGLSLARLQRYDQAYKHLRTALEQEQPKTRSRPPISLFAGRWAGRRSRRTSRRTWLGGSPARPLPAAGQRRVGRHLQRRPRRGPVAEVPLSAKGPGAAVQTLAGVQAVDPPAAPPTPTSRSRSPRRSSRFTPGCTSRAASVHGAESERDLDLFARAFRDRRHAEDVLRRAAVELGRRRIHLSERSAARSPAAFPTRSAPDYPPKGEAFLLARSRQEEEAGRKDAALECVEVLLRLAPPSLAGHDRLACLHYRKGDMDRAPRCWPAGTASTRRSTGR